MRQGRHGRERPVLEAAYRKRRPDDARPMAGAVEECRSDARATSRVLRPSEMETPVDALMRRQRAERPPAHYAPG